MKSIQSKFLTIIISGILILSVVIALISFVFTSRILEKDSDMITDSVANVETFKINALMRDVEYVVKSMENHVLSTVKSIDFLADEVKCDEYTAKAKTTFYAIVGNFDVIAGFYLRFSPEVAQTDSGFLITKTQSSIANYTEHPTTDLSDWQNAPEDEVCWFTEPMKSEDAVWLAPRTSATSKLEVVSYVVPIYVDNTFIGVVGVDLFYSAITDMVSEIHVYNNGFAYLMSGDNTITFSPVSDHKLQEAEENHGFAEEHRTLTNGMTLVIHADYTDIQSDGYRMMSIIIITSVVFMLVFAVIILFITKKIVLPLKKLTEAAEAFSEGGTDFNFEECNTKDEVGVLAAAFEKMTEKQQEYLVYINALAYKDSLTGVKNRTAYNDILTELDLKIKMGRCEPFALFVSDINGLKATNDKYGHEIGNKLIIRSAKIVCDVFKHSPVYRIGGDEFVVVMRGEDLDNRDALLERLGKILEEAFITAGDIQIPIGMAYSIAEYDSVLDITFEDVFNRADKKMYEHKMTSR